MKTAFITGGMGLIGSFIARRLINDNLVDKVVLLDHFGRYVDSSRNDFMDYRSLRISGIEDRVKIERGEAKHFNIIYNLLDTYKPVYIYHLAALPLAKLQNLNTHEAIEGSVISTSNILESIGMLDSKHGYMPERFIYASSSMVYGDFKYTPADEGHPTNPKEVYGTMKLAGEVIVKGLSAHFGIKSVIIGPSAVYGPTDMNRRVSQIFLEKAMLRQKIKIQGEDEALDFTFVKDIAKGFVLASQKEEAAKEIFNITSGKAYTLLEYVRILKEHFPWVEYEIVERDNFRPKRGTLSNDKARKLLGYEPDFDLRTGLGEYIKFIKENNPKVFKS